MSKPTEHRLGADGGFSLIEVALAVGIFALAIVGIIGLLAPSSRSAAEVLAYDDASRVLPAVQAYLQRKGVTTVAGYFSGSPRIFSSRGGDKIATADPGDSVVWDPSGAGTAVAVNGEKFFEIVLRRDATLSPAANDARAGSLAFTLELRWPAYGPDGTEVLPGGALSDDDRSRVGGTITVPMAILR